MKKIDFNQVIFRKFKFFLVDQAQIIVNKSDICNMKKFSTKDNITMDFSECKNVVMSEYSRCVSNVIIVVLC